MKKVCMAVIALAAIAIVAGPAMAQPGMGGQGSGLSLLTFKDTAAELKLSEDQIKKFKEIQDKRPGRRDGQDKMKEWNEEVTKAIDGLKDDQKKRLEQLKFQQNGVNYFVRRGGRPGGGGMGGGLSPDAVKELGIGDDDKKKLEEVASALSKARQELGNDRMSDEYRKKSAELNKTYIDKFVAALPADAKKKYEEKAGAAYKGEFPNPFGMRPGTGA